MDPKYFGALVSGQTAALALKHCGQVRPGETVLVTAAAGAAGQMAVQYAKHILKAKTVIGTCSNAEKDYYLKVIIFNERKIISCSGSDATK